MTSGSATTYFFGDLSLAQLFGTDLRIIGEGAGSHGGGPGEVGSTANLNGSFSFFPISGPIAQTVGGTTYSAILGGGLTFTTEPFVVQPPAGGETAVTFRVPFAMTGTVQGYTPAGPFGRERGPLLFSIDVLGNGTATQSKTFRADEAFYVSPHAGIIYTFEGPAAATPEPATMLLLGTGAAGLLLRRHR